MRRSGISKYLFEESLVSVADRISDDSVVIVYQRLQRDRSRFWDDVEERCSRVRDAVEPPGCGVPHGPRHRVSRRLPQYRRALGDEHRHRGPCAQASPRLRGVGWLMKTHREDRSGLHGVNVLAKHWNEGIG